MTGTDTETSVAVIFGGLNRVNLTGCGIKRPCVSPASLQSVGDVFLFIVAIIYCILFFVD
jgi:hypothetical protein